MDEPTKLYAAQAAAHAGVKLKTWEAYRARGQGPRPDGKDLDRHYLRPWWKPETIDAWKATRRGQEWRRGQHGESAPTDPPDPIKRVTDA